MNKRTRIILCAALLAFAISLTALSPLISAQAAASAPVAENLELSTYRNVSVGGRLSAVDPEGDVLTYEITTQPSKGAVELKEDGKFVYTPNENKRGRDYFGYTATDADGNRSQEATVIIKIAKQKCAVTYSDMSGDANAYAAVRLAEEGVFTGEKLGSKWVFNADRAVTRGEFLSMCMELCGVDLISGVTSTGFTDDDSIPVWQKSYVATALMDGLLPIEALAEGAAFDAGSAITCSDAAVILDAMLSLTDVAASKLDLTAPEGAIQAVSNLAACGMLPDGCEYTQTLTRSDAAVMLSGAMDVIAARK